MKSLSELEKRKREDHILKDKKVLLNLRSETDNCTIKDMRNLLVEKKETKQSKIK